MFPFIKIAELSYDAGDEIGEGCYPRFGPLGYKHTTRCRRRNDTLTDRKQKNPVHESGHSDLYLWLFGPRIKLPLESSV